MSQTLDRIPFARMDGREATLADYAGSVVLIVNVASKCGLTPQYEALQTHCSRLEAPTSSVVLSAGHRVHATASSAPATSP